MYQHINILEYGSFLGIKSERLTIKNQEQMKEVPLNRIKSITINKKGVSISSDLLLQCSARGIKVFLLI